MAIDPVCKMNVDESTAAGTSEHDGKTYYFCALACKRKFEADPNAYTGTGRPGSGQPAGPRQ
jgi:YHS domain-containing protein